MAGHILYSVGQVVTPWPNVGVYVDMNGKPFTITSHHKVAGDIYVELKEVPGIRCDCGCGGSLPQRFIEEAFIPYGNDEIVEALRDVLTHDPAL